MQLHQWFIKATACICLMGLVIMHSPGLCAAEGAGVIKGKVLDAASGAPIVGANVALEGTTRGGVADEDGRFTIPVEAAGTYVLRVTHLGFESGRRSVVVGDDLLADEITFHLVSVELLLDEMVVEETIPTSEADSIRQSPFSVTVIDAAQLVGRGLTLDEALQRVTGMQVRRSGGLGSASIFHIRGLEGNRIQVYVNGNAVNISGNAFSLDNIPLSLVERVEVYKGVVPARFGGDGLGAAVNVVIRDFPEGYEDASYTFGSFGQHQASALLLRRPHRDLAVGATANFDLAANDYWMSSPFIPGFELQRDHDAFRRLLVGGVLQYEGSWFDELHAEGALIRSWREIQGIQTNVQHAKTNSRIGVLVLDGDRQGALDGRLDLRFAVIALETKAALIDTSSARYTFDGNAYPSPNGRGELAALPAHSDNRTRSIRHRGAATYRFAPAHVGNLTYTLDHVRFAPRDTLANRYAGGNVSEFPGRQTNAVMGLSHEWRPMGEVFVNVLGTRAYAFRSQGTPSNPWDPTAERPPMVKNRTLSFGASNAVRYFVTPDVLAKGSIELARRLPESNELFGDGLLLQPSPTLKPERSVNLNVGLQFERGRPSQGHIRAEVNGFWMRLQDMIQLAQGGRVGAASYTNVGKARIAGFDAELKGDLTGWLYASASMTYQDARDKLKLRPGSSVPNPTYGLQLPNMPWLFGAATLEAHATDLIGPSQQSRLFWETSFTEEYFYAFEMSRNQERRLPRVLTHTLGFEHQWLDSGLSLSAEVQNITDAHVLNQYRQPLPGRTFRLKFRYTRTRG